jgi:hypothetical protein
MGKYINKSKGHNGRIRIGIITKERGRTIGVEHIGVGHNEEEVKMYYEEIKRVYEKVVIARIIEPASKIDTIEILEE